MGSGFQKGELTLSTCGQGLLNYNPIQPEHSGRSKDELQPAPINQANK